MYYGSDARVANQYGPMGRFYVEYLSGCPFWVYYEMALQTRCVYGPDLFAAEVDVSKRFIGTSARLVAENAARIYLYGPVGPTSGKPHRHSVRPHPVFTSNLRRKEGRCGGSEQVSHGRRHGLLFERDNENASIGFADA